MKRFAIFPFALVSVFGLTLPRLPKIPVPPAVKKNLMTRGENTWTTNGPWGGLITSLDLAPDRILYAGTVLNGVYKRVPGKEWVPANTSIEYTSIRALKAKINGVVFAGTESGLYISTDRGDHWTQNLQIPQDSVNTICFADAGADTIYVGCEHTGLFRSTDGGLHWSKLTPNFDRNPVTAIAVVKELLSSKNVLYVGTRAQGLYSSSNNGSTWKPLTSAPGNNIRALLGVRSSTINYLFAGTGDRGCFFSTDGGFTWSAERLDIPTNDLVARTNQIYAATDGNGVFTIQTGAATWQPVGQLDYKIVSSLALDQTDLYAGTTGGVFHNTGPQWEDYNDKLAANFIQDIGIDPETPGVVYATSMGGGLYRSGDNGQNWKTIPLPDNPASVPVCYSVALNPNDRNEIYVGSAGSIFRSLDGGVNWQSLKLPPTDLSAVLSVAVDPQTPTTIFAGTALALYKSTDRGDNWSKIWSDHPPVYSVVLNPDSTQIMYIATYDGVYKSTNGASSFFPASTGLPANTLVWSLALDPSSPNIIFTSFFITRTGLFRSLNSATSWDSLPLNNYVLGLSTDKNLVLAGAYGQGAYVSLDSGATWQQLNNGLDNFLPYTSNIDLTLNHSLYLGTLGGVYVYTDSLGPTVTLFADLDTISPDGDGIADSIGFHLNAADLKRWQLVIRNDRTNDTVYTLEGDNILPPVIFWEGYNKDDELVINGNYTARIWAEDLIGNAAFDSVGFTYSAKPMVSGDPAATFPPTSRKLARDKNDTLHCVYTTGGEVFYTRSGDNGTTWDSPVNLSNSEGVASLEPSLALDSLGNIYVSWQESSLIEEEVIYWRRFRQNRWEEKTGITNPSPASYSPVIVSDLNNNIHLVWTGYSSSTNSSDIFYKVFNYNNQLWGDSVNISLTGGDSKAPTLAVTPDGKVHIFWCDNSTGNYQIRYREKNAAKDTTLTATTGNALDPSVVCDAQSNLYLVWCDSLPVPEVLFKKYSASSGWSSIDTVSAPDTASRYPSIGIDNNNNLYVAWQEGAANTEVYLRSYTGAWQPTQNLSQSSQSSNYPSIAGAISSQAEIVWTEGSSKPYTIRFSATSGPTDTTKPSFIVTAPDTAALGDTIFVIVTPSEPLDTLNAWLFDGNNDSTLIHLNQDTTSGNVVTGTAPGNGRITVWGKDRAGNEGSKEKPIVITDTTTVSEFLDKTKVYAYPSPAKGDTIKFHFVLGEWAKVDFDIFTITGRRIYSWPEQALGPGNWVFEPGSHDVTMLTNKLGSDVYIFRLTAEATTSDKHDQVIKKFAVIH